MDLNNLMKRLDEWIPDSFHMIESVMAVTTERLLKKEPITSLQVFINHGHFQLSWYADEGLVLGEPALPQRDKLKYAPTVSGGKSAFTDEYVIINGVHKFWLRDNREFLYDDPNE